MSETIGAPSGDAAASSAPADSGAAAVDVTTASAGGGNAPAIGGDAAVGGEVAQPSSALPPAGYLFGGRTYRDQKHAEEAIKAQIGRVPQTQRENAELRQQLSQLQAESQALRQMVAQGIGPGQAQGSPRGAQQEPDSQSFADRLAKNGDLQWIAQQAEEKGLGHAFYAMAQEIEQHFNERLQAFRAENVEPLARDYHTQQGLTRFNGSVAPLLQDFPEFMADPATDPSVAEAQAAVLEAIRTKYPPEFLVQHPEVVRNEILAYRYEHGVPAFAQPPGSSGSPSAYAMAAAETQTATPLDGSGVPRQRASGVPESANERIRRENRDSTRVVRTPSGRPLFEEAR